MTDLRTLHDAFSELERRADVVTAQSSLAAAPPSRARRRLVPVAAAVAVVAGLVTGAALLVRDDDSGSRAAGPPATPPATSAQVTPARAVPKNPEELADRFRVVLGDLATFTVTETGAAVELPTSSEPNVGGQVPPATGGSTPGVPVTGQPTGTPNGAAIVGSLTSAGVTGGFDLQIYKDASEPWCDTLDDTPCESRVLPDGTKVAIWQQPLSANSVTYGVNLVWPNGSHLIMHLSNEVSPKGDGNVLAPQPPLTVDQLVAICTSDRW